MAQEPQVVTDPSSYCRQIETYLCQKNEGHLIRIVGPAFEQVCGWAERGVPLKIAFRGIDRYCERHAAKRGRRRPVRIEFCEADILDAFDDWRRALGVVTASDDGESAAPAAGRKGALATHIERVVARLDAVSSSSGLARSARFREVVESTRRELTSMGADARSARGDARARLVERLASLDADLLAAAVAEVDNGLAAELKQEADTELAPFGPRMSPDVRDAAWQAAYGRLVREAMGVPVLAYE
jgi:hypothetical protein